MNRRKLNVVFLHVDQLKATAIGAYGAAPEIVRTPGMDAIAREGTLFERSYTTNPICMPSRTCWYTGLPSEENGVVENGGAVKVESPTLGSLVRDAGYDSLYIGKWHVSTDLRKEFTVLPGGHSRGEIGDAGVARSVEHFFATHRSDRPFFLNIGLLNPHDICYFNWEPKGPLKSGMEQRLAAANPRLPPLPPNFAPEPSDEWTEEQWRMYAYTYFRYTEMVDAEIGRIFEAFRQSRFADDTVFIFSADHGQGNGEHGHHTKSAPYEHSLRVPLLLCGPDIPKGQRIRELVSGLDICPTICQLSGAKKPARAFGTDLVAMARDPAARQKERAVAGCTTGLKTRWLATERHKVVQVRGSRQAMLFDLQADPFEQNNLATAQPTLAAEMLARLDRIEAEYQWHPAATEALGGKRRSKGDDE